MIENKEALLIRATLIFLALVYILKLEFWPVSHYPVFSTSVEAGKFTSYRMAFAYQDERIVFPLMGNDARRLDVYLEHEFDPRNVSKRVGKLNMYAGIGMVRMRYHGRLDELAKLLKGVESAFILREWHQKIEGEYRVVKTEKLFEIGGNELFERLL